MADEEGALCDECGKRIGPAGCCASARMRARGASDGATERRRIVKFLRSRAKVARKESGMESEKWLGQAADVIEEGAHEVALAVAAERERPEYVKCIVPVGLVASHERYGKTWCGEKTQTWEWYFQGAEHAALSGHAGNRQVPCPECVVEIARGLGCEEHDERAEKKA